MPIDDSEDIDLDTQEPVVLDDKSEESEVEETDPDDQDDSQDDDYNDGNLDDDSDAGEEDGTEPAAASPPRGKARHQVLANRAKAAEAKAEAIAAELAAFRAQSDLSKKAELDEAEAARVAAMDPTQRDAYEARKESQSTKQALAYLNFKMEDSSDKSLFAAKAIVNPVRAKYADRVEAKLVEMRKQGQNTTREIVYKFLLGEDADKKYEAGGAGPKKKSAASRVDAARSKPARGRSDAGGYKPKGKTAEDRLEGVLI